MTITFTVRWVPSVHSESKQATIVLLFLFLMFVALFSSPIDSFMNLRSAVCALKTLLGGWITELLLYFIPFGKISRCNTTLISTILFNRINSHTLPNPYYYHWAVKKYALDMRKICIFWNDLTMHITQTCIFRNAVTIHILGICILADRVTMHICEYANI